MSFNFKAIIIIGSTASGKTGVAHSLADLLEEKTSKKAELVNLDAFQVYRQVTAGTAKPLEKEIADYRYHCVSFLDPQEPFDALAYAKKAHKACQEITDRGNIPVCVGGSGLYLRAFLHGLDELPPRNMNVRNILKFCAELHGREVLHSWLSKIDPVRAQELHPNDYVRVERALELFLLTDKPPSENRSKTDSPSEQKSLFPSFIVRVEKDDSILKTRIKKRVPILYDRGWKNEVEGLLKKYGDKLSSFQSMKAIGYRDLIDFLGNEEEKGLENLFDKIATSTWQYAKRQKTWNAKEKVDCIFSDEEKVNELYQQIVSWLF